MQDEFLRIDHLEISYWLEPVIFAFLFPCPGGCIAHKFCFTFEGCRMLLPQGLSLWSLVKVFVEFVVGGIYIVRADNLGKSRFSDPWSQLEGLCKQVYFVFRGTLT